MNPLQSRPLCTVDIQLETGAPITLGRSPWRNRRISYIEGGTITGERLSGVVRPGGGDWSEGGQAADGTVLTLIDVRALWTTHDGAEIYVTYGGRLVIPPAAMEAFRDPARVETLADDAYSFRINPIFETAAPQYAWLNAITAIGRGRRTARGVRYDIFEIL